MNVILCGLPAYIEQDNPKSHFKEIAKAREIVFERLAQAHITIDQLSPEEIVFNILRMIKYG